VDEVWQQQQIQYHVHREKSHKIITRDKRQKYHHTRSHARSVIALIENTEHSAAAAAADSKSDSK
jgi:hypothetical protein